MANKIILLLIPTLFLFSCQTESVNRNTSTEAPSTTNTPITVMAYYVAEKDYQPENLPLDQLTHIIFFFHQRH